MAYFGGHGFGVVAAVAVGDVVELSVVYGAALGLRTVLMRAAYLVEIVQTNLWVRFHLASKARVGRL